MEKKERLKEIKTDNPLPGKMGKYIHYINGNLWCVKCNCRIHDDWRGKKGSTMNRAIYHAQKHQKEEII